MSRPGAGEGERPLAGLLVVDLTRVLSGPHATRMLADLGADVVKVEPPSGDLTRFTHPRVGSQSTYYTQQNVGKANVSIDLDHPEGVVLLRRLIACADVLVENFRAGVMERLGLSPDSLLADNPRLVCASITGYGQRGPWSHRRSFAPVVQAEAGITRSQGDARGGEYRNDPHSHGDVYTAKETVAAILAALYRRERTGRGQLVEVSMAETMLYVNEHAHLGLWDRPTPEGEVLSFRPADYPILRTADGSLAQVSGHPAERGTFELYVAAIGRPELAADDRFRDTASRLRNLVALVAEIAVWAAAQADAEAAIDRLAEHGLAAGRLRDVADLAATQWARERGAVVDVDDRAGGTIRLPNSPWIFSESDTSVRGVSRYRGEDNRQVLRERLGLTDDEIDRLEADGIIVARVPPASTA